MAVPADTIELPGSVADDGGHRRRLAAVVVLIAVACAGGGLLIGRQLKSPEDAAADRAAPTASRITAPVELRELRSSLTLSGEIQFSEPTPVKLAGNVGLGDGETGLLTKLPDIDQQVAEGDVVFDVSGRPVLLLQGETPMYRSLGPGSTGRDVLQLEQSLERLGFVPGGVDTVYDGFTEAAIDEWYRTAGYTSMGASSDDLEKLRTLRLAITTAEATLLASQQTLSDANKGPSGGELLQLQQQVALTTDQLPVIQAKADRDNSAAAQRVQATATTRDTAITQRDLAKAAVATASTAGAIDPATGEAYTVDEINARRSTAAQAEQAVTDAQTALSDAQNAKLDTGEAGSASVVAAQQAKALAKANLDDATRPKDTTDQQQAVTDATAALAQAQIDLADTDALIGTRIPAGEVVFIPSLPSTVTEVTGTLGGPTTDVLATVSSTATQVIGRLGRADGDLVAAGAAVTIDLRDFDVEIPGTVTFVGKPPSTDGGGDSGSGRLQVIVAADEPSALNDYVFASVKIIVDIAATGGKVLTVPIAAVSVSGSGTSQVEVEREPITDDDPGLTEFIDVEVGLSAQGLVELRSSKASLAEGDRVVVGEETGARLNATPDEDSPETSIDSTSTDGVQSTNSVPSGSG